MPPKRLDEELCNLIGASSRAAAPSYLKKPYEVTQTSFGCLLYASYWEEAPGKIQDVLEGVCLLASLRVAFDHSCRTSLSLCGVGVQGIST